MRRYTVSVDGTPFLIDVEETAADRFSVTVGDRTFTASLVAAEDLPGAAVTPGIAVGPEPGAPAPAPVAPAPGAVDAPSPAMPLGAMRGGSSPTGVTVSPAAAAGTAVAAGSPARASSAAARPAGGGTTRPATAGVIAAPMPGVILEVHVGAGEPVTRGDPLCVLEAMKMRNTIRAPRDGVVTAVHVEAGRPVLPGEALVTLADPPR